MPSPEEDFLVALNKFKTRLSKDEEAEFQLTSLEDVQNAILRIQKAQSARKEMMNFTRIQSFLEATKQFGAVIEVFLNTNEFVAFVWGPMKFLLQIASAWSEAFDTLLDAYQHIAEHIPLLLQYRSLFELNKHMKHALAKMYEDILEFHRRALRVFSRSTWRQLFRATWKDFDAQFAHILKDLAQHKALIESQATLIHFQEAQVAREKARMDFEKAETERKHHHYVLVRDWLSPTDALLDQTAASNIRTPLPETGRWVLEGEKVKAWCQSDVPKWPKLWMYGIPGAGKTILASVIIENCLGATGTTCIYFYCKQGDPHRNNFLSLARTLLAQLLQQHQDLLPHFYDQLLSSGQSSVTSLKLCQELLQMTLQHGQKTHIITDGLDECDESERRTILSWFNSAVDDCSKNDPGRLRILFVSQDVPDIRKMLHAASSFRLTADNTGKDIEPYVRHWTAKIKQKFEIADGDVYALTDSICKKAEGMFLYAKLVVTNLYAQPSLAQLKEEIAPDRLPNGLEQAYERIIVRIATIPNRSERVLAQKLLGWMVCAKRPFKWHEIQGAISTDTESQEISFNERRLRIHIRDLCGSLVDVLPGDRVELVHWTAKGYILRQGLVRRREVEGSLAALCLQFLTFECFDNELSKDRLEAFTSQGYFAFQEYAVAHWFHHVECFVGSKVTQAGQSELESLAEFGTAVSDFVNNYELQLTPDAPDASNGDDISICKDFFEYEWYSCLEILLRHIRRHQKRGLAGSDEISISTLREAFFRNRQKLETLVEELHNNPEEIAIMRTYYGINWFRCSKLSCDYFHEGFPDHKRREQHMNRHDRPFRCTYPSCKGSIFGFDTAKSLDKHIKNTHPPDGQFTFVKLKDSKPAVSEFKCDVCSAVFNRKFNLRSHIRTKHTGERPFKCSLGRCGKAFGRENDRRRHEITHTYEKKFVCGVNLDSEPIQPWGCGSRFARLEGLKKHFSRAPGSLCLIPFWRDGAEDQFGPTDKIQKLRNAAVEYWKARLRREHAVLETKKRGREVEEPEVELTNTSEDSTEGEVSELDLNDGTNLGRKSNLTSFDSEMLGRLPSFLESPNMSRLPNN